ncbi:MAG TPA: hypothetical protein VL443_18220 [Cyclobacteriaceae bacterium]|jgi:hypothetical protein|nr:hypothetical protein [Cyclobacteriaceae bacterium]
MTEEIECLLVENSIHLLADFFQVISDGYNPTSISTTIKLNGNLDERDYFVLPSHLGGSNQKYFESVMRTKKDIESVEHRIEENFQWCLDHLTVCTQVPILFKSKFHVDNLKTLIQGVQNQAIKVVKNWQPKVSEYSIGSERRILIIHGTGKTIAMEFGCYIH